MKFMRRFVVRTISAFNIDTSYIPLPSLIPEIGGVIICKEDSS